MSKIAEQKALEEYPTKICHSIDSNRQYREGYVKGYDQAMRDIFYYTEARISCGELSAKDIRSFIEECKEYFKGKD